MRLHPVALCLLLPTLLSAQADRYELGLRLRTFERHLGAATDAGQKQLAFAELNNAVQAFFRLDLPGVARSIAASEAALRGKPFTADEAFAQRLQLQFDSRLAATGDAPLGFTLALVWKDEAELPKGLHVRAVLDHKGAKPVDVPLSELPCTGALPLAGVAAGDHTVQWQVLQGDTVVLAREQNLSLANDLTARLAALPTAADDTANATPSIESLTLRAHARMLTAMTKKRGEETVLPGERLLREAEALLAAKDTPYYGPARDGEYWLRVPAGKQTFTVRLRVPPTNDKTQKANKVPLLILLHGAGGSENLFFDGYGDGAAVHAGARRGWYVVAPRLGMGTIDLPALIDALAARYPIDPTTVMVIGHSMGAMQTVAAVDKFPARYRAAVALGGGGSVRTRDGKTLPPFFVGVGDRDFALSGARQLQQTLQTRGARSELHEYPGVEHLAVVQVACDDVFAFLDQALRSR